MKRLELTNLRIYEFTNWTVRLNPSMRKLVISSLTRAVIVAVIVIFSLPIAMTAQQPTEPKQQEEFVPISQLPAQDQLPAAPLLVTAYAFVWVALFGYVVSVARRLSQVQREIERLDADIKRGTSS